MCKCADSFGRLPKYCIERGLLNCYVSGLARRCLPKIQALPVGSRSMAHLNLTS
jgi:hypothetical protein